MRVKSWLEDIIGGGGYYTASLLEAQLSSQEFLASYSHPKLASALSEKRLIRLSGRPEIWAYMGRRRDYVIVPRIFCSCRDFLVNSVGRSKHRPCYHLVAQVLASRQEAYRELAGVIDDYEAWRIVSEILEDGLSRTMRAVLRRLGQL